MLIGDDTLTKNTYYYGVKLHAMGFLRTRTIPSPEYLLISKASDNAIRNSLTLYVFARTTQEGVCTPPFALQTT